MDKATLLWEVAFRKAIELDFDFDSNCEIQLRNIIYACVNKIGTDHQIDEAINNLKTIIIYMVRETKERGYTSLHEDTLFNILKKLCPIFPFC